MWKICHSFFPVYLYGAGPEWTACPGSESVHGCFSNTVWPAVGHKKRKRRKKKSNMDQTKVWGWFLCHFLSHRPLCPVMGLVCVCECVWYHPAIKVRLSVTLSPDCFQSHRFAVWSTVRLKPNELSVCKVQILSYIWRNLCLRKFDHLAPLNSN